MRRLTDAWFRLRALVERRKMQRELDEEVAFHLEKETEKLVARGLEPAEARRRAHVSFGGPERFREQARASWGVSPIHDLVDDLRFAVRQLLKHPAFSALAALTLALGIGGTVALFSVVHGLMLRPLPVSDEDRLAVFWMDYWWRGEEFDLVKEVPRGFERIAAYSIDAHTLRTDDGSSVVVATVGSAELFDVLGAPPLSGRTFQAGDDRPGSEPIVVLTHGFWERELGADPSIIGRPLVFDGVPRTVVGIMPEGFFFPTPETDVFVPLDLDPNEPMYANNGWLVLVGKRGEGVTDRQVQDDLRAITQTLDERYDYTAQADKTRDPYATPLREYLLGDVRPALLLLLAAVAVLLLMACVNVAGLILTRTVDRTGEMSVRAALGAGRARLARQILTESIALGTAGGLIGLVLAIGLFDVMVGSLPITSAFQETLALDWTALLAALTLAVLAGGLIGLAPIRSLLRGELSEGALSTRTPGGRTAHSTRLQSGLVVAEVLLAVVLATGAGLLIRTVEQLRAIDPGLDPEGVLAVDVIVSDEESTPEERSLFLDALVERLGGLPTVSAAGLINRLPLRDGGWQSSATIPDRPDLDGPNRPMVMHRPVSPETFEALGVEVVEGRGIEPSDLEDTSPVAVINQTFARRIWGDESPLGRTYTSGNLDAPVEVVGVVRDIAVEDLIGTQPLVGFHAWSQTMATAGFATVVVRTSGDPASLVAPLRALVHEMEPRAAIGRVETMQDVMDRELAEPLRLRFFLGLFSALGIVLGAVGVYGVVAYSVERRRAELGIRSALGAARGRLLVEIIGRGMVPVVIGVVAGSLLALLGSGTLAGFLFEVEPTDASSLLAAAATLLLSGMLAALLPALRASRTTPSSALRAE